MTEPSGKGRTWPGAARSGPGSTGVGQLRDAGGGDRQGLLVGDLVLQLAAEVLAVRGQVEVTVSGKSEQDGLLAALGLALEGLVDGGPDRVRRLRRGQDALGAGELHPGVEAPGLRHRDRVD